MLLAGGGGSQTSRCQREFAGPVWLPLRSGSPMWPQNATCSVSLPSSLSTLLNLQEKIQKPLSITARFVLNFPPHFPREPRGTKDEGFENTLAG